MERKGEFPRAVRLSKNRVAYDEDEIDGWIQSRAEESYCGAAA
jgi:predicted DNA-binding transcriptional regulator AlpA